MTQQKNAKICFALYNYYYFSVYFLASFLIYSYHLLMHMKKKIQMTDLAKSSDKQLVYHVSL